MVAPREGVPPSSNTTPSPVIRDAVMHAQALTALHGVALRPHHIFGQNPVVKYILHSFLQATQTMYFTTGSDHI